MNRARGHAEHYPSDRVGWLHATMLGVATAGTHRKAVLLTSVPNLSAAAMSMEASAFVSVQLIWHDAPGALNMGVTADAGALFGAVA